ncbi:MAG TPA: PAAR domain-containing protein [Polyangium sp.]|nr:PAAR domain-containing protein [Polyangium sp.]
MSLLVARKDVDICTGHDACPPRKAIEGSPDVFMDGHAVVRLGDLWETHGCPAHSPHKGKVIQASDEITVNGLPVVRVGDPLDCGSKVKTGSDNLYAGGGLTSKTETAPAKPAPDKPAPDKPAPAKPGSPSISPEGQKQMQAMLQRAKADSTGRRPDGRCYSHVAGYLDQEKYGKLGQNFNAHVPSSHWAEARQFGEYMNQGDRLEKAGLQRLPITNPYDAPPGSIVLVRAGTPGTRHPTAGGIAIKGEGDIFYNGGEMSYGGRQNFPPGNHHVIGIYAPK